MRAAPVAAPPRAGDRDDNGASAVEFAMLSSVLFLVVFGIIQYGVFFWALQSGVAAARETVRQSAVGKYNCAELDTAANGQVPASANAARTFYPSGTSTAVTSTPRTGGDVQVNVTFAVPVNLGLFPLPDDGTINESARARVEAVSASLTPCT